LEDENPPSRHQVRDVLHHLLIDIGKIPPEKITDDACVDGELKMESVVFIEIQVALEEAFDIDIDPMQMIELNELDAIVDYLHRCVCMR